MTEITNPKIEKQKGEIEKTKAKIAEFQAKQREQEKQLRALEDLEIVAQFRKERVSDERLQAVISSKRDGSPANTEADEVSDKTTRQEDTINANIKEN